VSLAGIVLDRIVLSEFVVVGGAIFSPDGATIYFYALDFEGTQGIWFVPTRGGIPKLAIASDDPSLWIYLPGISVGPETLYVSVAEYESDIWVMDLEW
jgi:hypothetical protein